MTVDEYKIVTIYYYYTKSEFGQILIASTDKGVCFLGIENENNQAFDELKKLFSKATFILKTDEFQQKALEIFQIKSKAIESIQLHIKGTDFQLKVWESLLKIPFGQVSTYGKIAAGINGSKAFRAVGTAIGSNPVSIIIPCHRVIQSSGKLGGFLWGTDVKKKLLEWEK